MANYLDYFIHTSGIAFGQVYSSGRAGMNEREKFEKWAFDNNVTNLYPISFGAAWAAWQAALSTRKAYGYGIVDKDGNKESDVVMTESAADLFKGALTEHKGEWSTRGPFRVVELFYEDSES